MASSAATCKSGFLVRYSVFKELLYYIGKPVMIQVSNVTFFYMTIFITRLIRPRLSEFGPGPELDKVHPIRVH